MSRLDPPDDSHGGGSTTTVESTDREARVPVPKKLAQQVAERIEADIADRGLAVGTVVGSESDLLERFGVSRGVLREAVRLVEHQQIARMRRGPGGGLVVTEPDDGPVIDAVAVYMRFARITLDELFEARRVVESAATELAAAALNEEDLALLRADHLEPDRSRAGDLHELHLRIGRLSGNPALELFCGVLTRLTALYVGSLGGSAPQRRQRAEASHQAHAAIVAALVAGDAGLAVHRMRSHLTALEAVLRDQDASPSVIPELLGGPSGLPEAKLAEDLARTILREVASRGWPVGEVLGSESELMERHGVSRAVLREAVRLLEFHQIARTRRGPGGGLVVTEPGVDPIARAMSISLELRMISPLHLARLRFAVELALVELAAERIDDEGRSAVAACVAAARDDEESDLNDVGHDLHLVLADAAGNRLLALFVRILVEISARHVPATIEDRPADEVRAAVTRAHERIAEAVLAGDRALARHRMQRHLDALVPYFV